MGLQYSERRIRRRARMCATRGAVLRGSPELPRRYRRGRTPPGRTSAVRLAPKANETTRAFEDIIDGCRIRHADPSRREERGAWNDGDLVILEQAPSESRAVIALGIVVSDA